MKNQLPKINTVFVTKQHPNEPHIIIEVIDYSNPFIEGEVITYSLRNKKDSFMSLQNFNENVISGFIKIIF